MIKAHHDSYVESVLGCVHWGEGYCPVITREAYDQRRVVIHEVDLYALDELGLQITDSSVNAMNAKLMEAHPDEGYNFPMSEQGVFLHLAGTIDDLHNQFDAWLEDLAEGPKGADDDTFDYFPSHWGCCIQLAQDLRKLTAGWTKQDGGPYHHIEAMRRVWDSEFADYPEGLTRP